MFIQKGEMVSCLFASHDILSVLLIEAIIKPKDFYFKKTHLTSDFLSVSAFELYLSWKMKMGCLRLSSAFQRLCYTSGPL